VIGRLRGEFVEAEGSLAIVEVGGIGYEVAMAEGVLASLVPGEPVLILTRQIFREDGTFLYGFSDPFQRRLFDLLLTVKGCGPKVALALLGQVGEDSVASAILAQDARILSRASGVGPKLAERIALELRDKIQEESLLRKIHQATPRKPAPSDELVDALVALGYRRSEIDAVADEARGGGENVEEQLTIALRLLKR
jgi:Holliday junction DNA helicase RuvA